MIRTLEEAIIHAEEAANDYEEMIGDYALYSEKMAKCAKNQRQIAAWLRELAERRKAPEIVRCGECRHRDPEDKKCDCGHDIIWQLPRGDNWYCADAERRTDGDCQTGD